MKVIPEKIVTDYALTVQKIKVLEEAKQELRAKIIAAYNKGWTCSLKGPYILERLAQNRKQIDWKGQVARLLARLFPGDSHAQKAELDAIEAHAPVVYVDRLESKINPVYKAR